MRYIVRVIGPSDTTKVVSRLKTHVIEFSLARKRALEFDKLREAIEVRNQVSSSMKAAWISFV